MKRKTSLLFALAMAAVLATAAVAAAAVWKDKGVEVKEVREFNLTGSELFEVKEGGVEKGGMSCPVQATIKIENGTTSKVTKFNWTGAACSRFGTVFGSCTLSKWEATGLPWPIESITTTNFKVKSETIKRTFAAGCGILTLESTVTGGIWTPVGSATAIAELEFAGGTQTAKKEKTTTVEYKSFGSLTVDSPNSGTYGIG
jgi:hypothetical protein